MTTAQVRWLSIALSLVLAVVGGTVLLLWPRDHGPAAPTGEGALGVVPETSGVTAGSAPVASSTTAAPVTGSPSPGPSVTATVAPTVQSGSFAVSSKYASGLLGSTIDVSVRNVGAKSAAWHSVTLELNGLNLGVNVSDKAYVYAPQGGAHCVVPADGSQTLNPGGVSTFTLNVTGLLGRGAATALDTPPCPGNPE